MPASDFDAFRQQETIFATLNLFALVALLLLQTLLPILEHSPSALIAGISIGIGLQAAELIWLWRQKHAKRGQVVTALTCLTICMNISLSVLVAILSPQHDIQYFLLLPIPILEAAFRFRLAPTLAVIGAADALTFYWVWEFDRRYIKSVPGKYLESGMFSLTFALMGILTWLLVHHLEQRERRLARNLEQLQQAREQLLGEEKLAAVGRLSSAIAHEIRNPVAIITSALATTQNPELSPAERAEMWDIAFKESARLERLTTDFLAYARPRGPERVHTGVAETLDYVADICRVRSNEKNIRIDVDCGEHLMASMDAGQIQQALINLVLNGIEASSAGGRITLRARGTEGALLRIEVETGGESIPPEITRRLFEPFYTTKPGGTGLGLAIARNIARAHGGELVLSANQPGRVAFSLTLAAPPPALAAAL